MKGHEIMWPILLLSFVSITVIVERLLFIIRENSSREPEVVEKMLESVEKRDIEGALAIGKQSKDFVAKILVYSLTNKEYSLTNAFIRASARSSPASSRAWRPSIPVSRRPPCSACSAPSPA